MHQEEESYLFLQPFRLGDNFREVITVFALGDFSDEFVELRQRQKSAAERRLFGTANFYAGAFFNRLHISRRVVQTAARAGIQPREAVRQPLHMQLAALKI